MTKWLVAFIVLGTVIAGCLGDSPDDSEAPPSASGAPTEMPAPGAMYMMNRPWDATACKMLVGPIAGSTDYVNENLPDAYTSAGGELAELIFLVQECEAMSIGNDTLIEPFSMGLVYALVDKVTESTNRQEAFVFETILSDADLVEALQAYGWTAAEGSAVISEGMVTTFALTSQAVNYEGSLAREGTIPGATTSFSFLMHAGAPGVAEMFFDINVQEDVGLADPGSLQASDGVLAQAVPGGVGVYQAEYIGANTRSEFP